MRLSWICLGLLGRVQGVHGSQRDLIGAGVSQQMFKNPREGRAGGGGGGSGSW